jgi:hypothetical protein
MSTLYDRIVWACQEKNITPGRMCDDLGYRRGFMTDLKTANVKYLSCEKIASISDRLSVSCDFLLKGQETEFSLSERELIHAFKIAPDDVKENVQFLLRKYMPVSSAASEEKTA